MASSKPQASDDPFVDDQPSPPPLLSEQHFEPPVPEDAYYYPDQAAAETTLFECDVMFSGCLFGGADYLSVRPTFSDPVGLVEFTLGPSADRTDNRLSYDFGYTSNVRAFLGLRFCNCGGELLFTYTSMQAEASLASAVATSTTGYGGHLELNTNPGESAVSTASVDRNTYDLDYARPLLLPGCGQDCGGCEMCPTWALNWSVGVRLADISWQNGTQILSGNDVVRFGETTTSFNGAGPRLGLQARRYFGRCNQFSLFAQGHLSLLLGEYDTESIRVTTNTQLQRFTATRLLPVTEMEVGGSWQVGARTVLSLGYLFQVWHDLGMSQEIGGNLPIYDDANILSFDGLMFRGEFSF